MTFLNDEITGSDLPDQSLCFTYDDGPADQTLELAQFLYEKDVPVTFFLVGEHIHGDKILKDLVRLGHYIGNHTYSHANLTEEEDPQVTVNRCNEIIKPYVRPDLFFLRPPYGAWSPGLADMLNDDEDLSALHYKGPLNWHIGGTKIDENPDGYNADWYCWQEGANPEECSNSYIREIEDKGRGVVLMHDYGEDKEITDSNTLHLTQCLVPVLKDKGYQFYPPHWIPQIADLIRDDGDDNAMPEDWFDRRRGAHVDWHQIIINGGSNYYTFERTCNSNSLYWNDTPLAGDGKEIAGRADVEGLIFIFFMGLEDEAKIWYQCFKPGQQPSRDFKEFEVGATTSGLHSLSVIPETATLKFQFWGTEDEPKLWSREQTHPGHDEWGELKDETAEDEGDDSGEEDE